MTNDQQIMNKSCNPGDSIRDLVIPDSWRSRFIFEWGHVNSPSQKRSQIESVFLNPRDPIISLGIQSSPKNGNET